MEMLGLMELTDLKVDVEREVENTDPLPEDPPVGLVVFDVDVLVVPSKF
jgi:hypothetical protein